MHAVIQIGGSQYKVAEGEIVRTTRLKDAPGSTITLNKVLLFLNDSDIRIGQPYVPDVQITATVTKHVLGDKVHAFKFRRRKDSSTLKGHRQQETLLNITKIAV